MATVKFYRGTRENYDSNSMADGIFFAEDTHEILMNDESYGASIDNISLDGNELTLTVDGATQTVDLSSLVTGENAIEVTDNKVTLKISDNDLLLTNDSTGLSATIGLSEVTEGLDENVLKAYQLTDKNGKAIGSQILVYKDSSLKEVTYSNQTLHFTYILANGTESTVDVDISEVITESEFEKGLEVNDHKVSVKIDEASESFLTVSSDGVKLSGVQDAIDAAKEEAVSTADSYTDDAISTLTTTLEDEITTAKEEAIETAETYTDEAIANISSTLEWNEV